MNETPVPPAQFRQALGRFATGVAVITAQTDRGVLGITINSFTSVSLDPPLVLWCLDNAAARGAAFAEAAVWGVSILRAEQRAIADHFARNEDSAASNANFLRLEPGAPVIAGALAHLVCRTHARHPMGDHLVIVGEVASVAVHDGQALTYFMGRYGAASAA